MNSKTIQITNKMVHKTIKVKAKCNNICGKESALVEKIFFVKCPEVKTKINPVENTLIVQSRYDDKTVYYPQPFILGGGECIDYYYEINCESFKEVSLKSCRTQKEIDFKNYSGTNEKVYLSVRPFCRITEEWKGEQINIYYNMSGLPIVYFWNQDDNHAIANFERFARNGTLRIRLDGICSKDSKICINTNGEAKEGTAYSLLYNADEDYYYYDLKFSTKGNFNVKACSFYRGMYGEEKAIKIEVLDVVQATENFALSPDGENVFAM